MKRPQTKKEKALGMRVAELEQQVEIERADFSRLRNASGELGNSYDRLRHEHAAAQNALNLSNQVRELAAQGLAIERDELLNRAARLDMRIQDLTF